MKKADVQVLRARLQATARDVEPSPEVASRRVRVEDTQGGPDRWFDAELYFALQAETSRAFGIPEDR